MFGESKDIKRVSEEITNLEDVMAKLQLQYDHAQAKLRSVMDSDSSSPAMSDALQQVSEAEQALQSGVDELKNSLSERGNLKQESAHKNLAIAGGIGIPSMVGLGYIHENQKQ